MAPEHSASTTVEPEEMYGAPEAEPRAGSFVGKLLGGVSFQCLWRDCGISRLLPSLALKSIERYDLRTAQACTWSLLSPPPALRSNSAWW